MLPGADLLKVERNQINMNTTVHYNTNNFIKVGDIIASSQKFPSDNTEALRHKDFTPLIDTRIRFVGGKRQTRCPFHEERSPSFYIYPDNTYFCFGCEAYGNAIDFVMNKLGYQFKEACEILKDL